MPPYRTIPSNDEPNFLFGESADQSAETMPNLVHFHLDEKRLINVIATAIKYKKPGICPRGSVFEKDSL
jgi:hypothetical protein